MTRTDEIRARVKQAEEATMQAAQQLESALVKATALESIALRVLHAKACELQRELMRLDTALLLDEHARLERGEQ